MKLYALDVAPLLDDGLLSKLLESASPQRRQKILALKSSKDRALSLGAELLMLYALDNEGVIFPVSIEYGQYGKPYIANFNIHFNLSHSGTYAVCAIGDTEVGVDIEMIKTPSVAVARRCFSYNELSRVMNETGQPDPDEFYRHWTIKESYIKATGIGLRIKLSECEIDWSEPVTIGQGDDRRYYCRVYECIDGYKIAICSESPYLPEQVIPYDLNSIKVPL